MPRLSQQRREQLGYNPNRESDLFALTEDGYIIAHDIACQYEFIAEQAADLVPVAHINRAGQGLSEIVTLDPQSGQQYSFIFDISNAVYQRWMVAQFGDAYEPAYDGTPRKAGPQQ